MGYTGWSVIVPRTILVNDGVGNWFDFERSGRLLKGTC